MEVGRRRARNGWGILGAVPVWPAALSFVLVVSLVFLGAQEARADSADVLYSAIFAMMGKISGWVSEIFGIILLLAIVVSALFVFMKKGQAWSYLLSACVIGFFFYFVSELMLFLKIGGSSGVVGP